MRSYPGSANPDVLAGILRLMFQSDNELPEQSPMRQALYPPEDNDEEEPPSKPPDEEELPTIPEGTKPKGATTARATGADAFIKGMVRRGWLPGEAAAVAGNIHVESAFRSNIKSSVPYERSFGLLQWNGARLQGLQNYAAVHGLNWADPETQMDYINLERTGDSRWYGGGDERASYRRALTGGGSVADMAERFGRFVERPLRLSDTLEQRRRAAELYAG